MIIIGEKLNSSIPQTLEALKNHDSEYIAGMIRQQAQCGAHYLDINTALRGADEISDMRWVIELALANSDCGIMLDSPNPEVIAQCLPNLAGRRAFVNSITLDAKYDALIEAIRECGANVVCLPLQGAAIPPTAEDRLQNALAITQKLRAAGISDEQIYIDVLVEAVATGEAGAAPALDTIKLFKERLSGVNTICGLSNVSFGLPRRARLNSAFLAMAMQCGLDSAIVDATSTAIRDTLFAGNALLGRDEYCMEYINYSRSQL